MSDQPSSILVALGSNLGDRLASLRAAVVAVHQLPCTQVLSVAPLYETDPVDCPPESQAFYNSVMELQTSLALPSLLRELRGIEITLGRPSEHGHHAPRTVDLDILCAGQTVVNTEELGVPHPRMHLRRFVLQPAADLQPDLMLPGQNKSIAMLLHELNNNEPPLRQVARDWADLNG